MLRHTTRIITTIAVLVLASSPTYAVLITSGAAGTGTAGPTDSTTGAFAQLLSTPVITTGAEGNDLPSSASSDYTGTAALAPNTVSFSLDVFALAQPFDMTFDLDEGPGPHPGGSGALAGSEYVFSVTINNMIGANGIAPITPGTKITSFDFEIIPTNAFVSFESVGQTFSPVPSSSINSGGGSPLAFAVPNLGAPGTPIIRFGDLMTDSGAPGIPFGGSQTLTFSIDTSAIVGVSPSFTLRMTANPEPEAFVLAAVAFAALFYVHRRRQRRLAALSTAGTTPLPPV